MNKQVHNKKFPAEVCGFQIHIYCAKRTSISALLHIIGKIKCKFVLSFFRVFYVGNYISVFFGFQKLFRRFYFQSFANILHSKYPFLKVIGFCRELFYLRNINKNETIFKISTIIGTTEMVIGSEPNNRGMHDTKKAPIAFETKPPTI